jgi:hypothetical protein
MSVRLVCVSYVSQVEASEAEVKEWKECFCPRKEDDINWATGSVGTLVASPCLRA